MLGNSIPLITWIDMWDIVDNETEESLKHPQRGIGRTNVYEALLAQTLFQSIITEIEGRRYAG